MNIDKHGLAFELAPTSDRSILSIDSWLQRL